MRKIRNWKTTVAGLSAIFAVIAKIVSSGGIDWATDGPSVLTGIGLIAARDSDREK